MSEALAFSTVDRRFENDVRDLGGEPTPDIGVALPGQLAPKLMKPTLTVVHDRPTIISRTDEQPPVAPVRRTKEHVLLVASSGGHLAQLLALRPWWQKHQRTWVTFDTADARSQLEGEAVVFAHHPTTRNVRNLLRNSVVGARLMHTSKPTLIVSTGAAVAFPFFLYAKALGIPSVYLEVFDRVDSRTLTGRLCRPLASEFLVQWEQQLSLYRGARVIGTLL